MKNLNLQQLREKNGYTQKQVAELTKVAVNYIYMLEKGMRNPSDNLKEKLSKLYKCSIEEIFLAIKLTKC